MRKRPANSLRVRNNKRLLHRILINTDLYLLIVPALAVLFIFRYLPIYGIQIAFKDFNIRLGITDSPWVGFKHFQNLFTSRRFFEIFRNTLLFNVYRLLFQFPIPIIMALAIYEVQNKAFKRSIQTLSYLPHFLSWVVIGAIFMNLLSTQGLVNSVIRLFGREPVTWLAESRYFRSLLVISDAWKNSGWGSIVYLSAIMSVDTDLFEAARADGAGVLRRMWHITLPCIRPTIFFIIMLRLSAMLGSDVEQILVLYSPVVYDVGDVIGSYVYRVGLTDMKYSYSSAVGLFSSVIGFILLVSANYTSRAFGERTLW